MSYDPEASETPKVRLRLLTRSQLKISEIGFGAWGIGGQTTGETSYGDTDDATSNSALDKAAKCGLNFFDTSPAYGNGHSETLLGALNRRTDQQLIFSTKAGISSFKGKPDYSPSAIGASLTASLKRFNQPYIEGLLLHNPPIELLENNPETLDFLEYCVSINKLKFWGISAKSPDDALHFLSNADIPVLQVNLNMLDTRAISNGLLNLAHTRDTAIIARTPLCFGFLTGKVDENTAFPTGDHRNTWSQLQKASWARGARQAYESVQAEAHVTMTQIALRFCLSFPAVASVLPGPLTAEEVKENAYASIQGPLSESQIDRVLTLNQNNNFFI